MGRSPEAGGGPMSERSEAMGAALRVIERAQGNSPLSLNLPDDLSFEAWVDEGRRLCIGSHAIQWHIGDWWRHGVAHYGEEETRKAAADIWGVESETARNCGWVAAKFDPVARATELPFSHYRTVAALPEETAKDLIAKAADKSLTVQALRREVQAIKAANDGSAQVRSVEQPRAKPLPFAKHELAEAYGRYVELCEVLESIRPLTRREADFLTIALDYLGEAHAERRAVPDDFDVVFVEQGRLACESWYRASRITVNRWLAQRGKKRLIDERALFVKHQRAKARGDESGTAGDNAEPPVDSFLPIAKMAADFIRVSRYGRWPVSMAQDGHGWFVGSARRTSEELIAMAERQGFDVEAAKLEAKQEGY